MIARPQMAMRGLIPGLWELSGTQLIELRLGCEWGYGCWGAVVGALGGRLQVRVPRVEEQKHVSGLATGPNSVIIQVRKKIHSLKRFYCHLPANHQIE